MVAGSGALSQKGLPAVPDDMPSLGELGRRIEAMRLDIKEDIHDLARRLDAKVSMERYELERQAHAKEVADVAARITRVEEARKEDQRSRVSDRRWLYASLIFPAVIVVLGISLQVWLKVQGVL